jgi:hypothetical protein
MSKQEGEPTPGPWEYDGEAVRGDRGGKTVAVLDEDEQLSPDEIASNAALIASAPDLARKLDRARGALDAIMRCVDPWDTYEEAYRIAAAARAELDAEAGS